MHIDNKEIFDLEKDRVMTYDSKLPDNYILKAIYNAGIDSRYTSNDYNARHL
ncbi:hypothetical protein CWI39_0108p0020 [Hamiltosporidium magnivora]|uniref:Uncharacterized protein n=1 Tax=Hamiltosporidium magnivora TaxID=148818 RepID=A0A4Q9LLW4_9MICR|nr:hypothetical protein CWI39_0108p0020 [Hamiltosporidium magnivora]